MRNAPSKFKFKKSDKVICINNSCEEESLELNKMYIAEVIKNNMWMCVVGVEDYVFYANRFIPFTELNKELL